MGGINSLRGGVAAGDVIRELSQLRDKCNKNGIRPIFLTLLPINPDAIREVFDEPTAENWREQLLLVNDFIRQQKYYIDLEVSFADSSGLMKRFFASDGLHPGLEGKRLMAQIINDNWTRVAK
jgi:lysophospholipase L1-like esterase